MRDRVLFDGDCGLCIRASEIAKRIDRAGKFIVEPYQAYPEPELAQFGLSYADCSRKLQVVTAQGKVHSGAFGVNYFLWRQFPWSLVVALVYVIPVLLLLEVAAYRVVADNRHHLKACSRRIAPRNPY